ncbi:MAG TPA: hypothetical protein VFW07_11375 [Parafilimonas sp.]|nr:hypothetical protein [Parafilimonas sp.]
MRFRFFTILLFGLVISCKAKNTSADLENDLKATMQAYLYRDKNNDSANVKFRVLEVIYYDDKLKNMYDCEFKVNMKTRSLDTTGIMKANISKDFKKVVRLL